MIDDDGKIKSSGMTRLQFEALKSINAAIMGMPAGDATAILRIASSYIQWQATIPYTFDEDLFLTLADNGHFD